MLIGHFSDGAAGLGGDALEEQLFLDAFADGGGFLGRGGVPGFFGWCGFGGVGAGGSSSGRVWMYANAKQVSMIVLSSRGMEGLSTYP